jgi:hypothetical protein
VINLVKLAQERRDADRDQEVRNLKEKRPRRCLCGCGAVLPQGPGRIQMYLNWKCRRKAIKNGRAHGV